MKTYQTLENTVLETLTSPTTNVKTLVMARDTDLPESGWLRNVERIFFFNEPTGDQIERLTDLENLKRVYADTDKPTTVFTPLLERGVDVRTSYEVERLVSRYTTLHTSSGKSLEVPSFIHFTERHLYGLSALFLEGFDDNSFKPNEYSQNFLDENKGRCLNRGYECYAEDVVSLHINNVNKFQSPLDITLFKNLTYVELFDVGNFQLDCADLPQTLTELTVGGVGLTNLSALNKLEELGKVVIVDDNLDLYHKIHNANVDAYFNLYFKLA